MNEIETLLNHGLKRCPYVISLRSMFLQMADAPPIKIRVYNKKVCKKESLQPIFTVVNGKYTLSD